MTREFRFDFCVTQGAIEKNMVTGVGATMPTGGVTVGATPPAQHVPQEVPGQAAVQTTPTTTTTTRRSGENRRVSVDFLFIE